MCLYLSVKIFIEQWIKFLRSNFVKTIFVKIAFVRTAFKFYLLHMPVVLMIASEYEVRIILSVLKKH
jgi:hypothetical protein